MIIPSFERVESTVAAVTSAANQTRPPDAIIVVDDGSSDEVQEQLRVGLTDSPARLVCMSHSGHPGRVRNRGLKEIEASHVAFLDSDDLWREDKLEIQEFYVHRGCRAQGSGFLPLLDRQVNVSLVNLGSPIPGCEPVSLRRLLKSNVLCNSSVLVEKALIDDIGGLATSYAVRGIEDYSTWLRIATRTEWCFCSEPLVFYSDSAETSMRATNQFTINEGTLALWDFVAWKASQGLNVPIPLRALMRLTDRALSTWAGYISR